MLLRFFLDLYNGLFYWINDSKCCPSLPNLTSFVYIYNIYTCRRGYRIFWRGGDGQGGPLRGGGVIAPVGEKLLFEHIKFSATGGGDHPYHPPPLDPPLTCIHKQKSVFIVRTTGRGYIHIIYILYWSITYRHCRHYTAPTCQYREGRERHLLAASRDYLLLPCT